ncbi:uncharacterized protein LOC134763116 [Penaeus indicus]|uniref:uncharacterized protein LOC134763116 n=1 Tax=Penaeus indicus TaxID=29960 RepID=UPI00300D84BA
MGDFSGAEEIDVTNEKQSVYKQSTYNKAYKEGMEVNCKYVKRKQLTNYLSQEDLDKYKPKVEDGQPQTIRQKRKSDVGSQDSPSRESPENNKKPKIDGNLLLIFPPVNQITVYKQSTYNKAYKEGMEVNCKYVKRKQLTNYLSQEDLDKYKPKVEDGQPQTIRQKRKSDVGSQDSPSRESPENNKKPKIDGDLTAQATLNGDDSNISIDEAFSNTSIPGLAPEINAAQQSLPLSS